MDTILCPPAKAGKLNFHMDKKNTILGVICLIAAIGFWYWQGVQQRQIQPQPQQQQVQQQAQPQQPSQPAQAPTFSISPAKTAVVPEAAPAAEEPEQLVTLRNDLMVVVLSSRGGAVKSATFLDYEAVQGGEAPYSLDGAGSMRIMALDVWKDGNLVPALDSYAIVHADDTRVVFRREAAPGVFVERSFEISKEVEGPAAYTIRHATTFINSSGADISLPGLYVDLGVSTPDLADSYGFTLNAGYYNGDDFDYEYASHFEGGGWFTKSAPKAFEERRDNVVWGTVKNQFFATILTPVKPATSYVMMPVKLAPEASGKVKTGLGGALGFDSVVVAAGARADYTMSCYIGPKEYSRLSRIGQEQDRVLQFGWSRPLGFLGDFVGFIGKLFYTCLVALQKLVVNWGVAIVIMTILIRLLFWPLTAKAAESSRRMAKLQEPLKALREKYKDNPRKMNEETLALWKKHKVNPLAGCLPLLIQMPIFIAFYYMLRGASELRFAHFLWINDLSMQDTVATLFGFPVNIMPLLMGITMFYQMHLAPTPGADPMQAKIMKFMPLIFLVFCYTFSSGLVLYWTVSNCMSIIQQLHTNHKRSLEDASEAVAATPSGAIPVTVVPDLSTKGNKRKKR